MSVARRIGPLGPRAIARFYRVRDLDVRIEGLEHLPRRGAAVLAARHYHHVYDGSALIDALPRKPSIFVALDWAATPRVRAAMELACRLAGWPMTLRSTSLAEKGGASAYDRREVLGYVRRALADGARLLRDGKLLVVFPEGTPTHDVGGVLTKTDDDAILPFHAGFLTMVALAQRETQAPSRRSPRGPLRVPILPVGMAYEALPAGRKRFRVTVRFGAPRYYDARTDDRAPFAREIAAVVRELSLGSGDVMPGTYTLPAGVVLAGELAHTRDALAARRDDRSALRDAARGELRAARERLTSARDARRRAQLATLRDLTRRVERSVRGTKSVD